MLLFSVLPESFRHHSYIHPYPTLFGNPGDANKITIWLSLRYSGFYISGKLKNYHGSSFVATVTASENVLSGGAALRAGAQDRHRHALFRSQLHSPKYIHWTTIHIKGIFIYLKGELCFWLFLINLMNKTLLTIGLEQKKKLLGTVLAWKHLLNFTKIVVTIPCILGNIHHHIIFRPIRPQVKIIL